MVDEDTTKIMTPQEMAYNMQKVVTEHMKLAFKQYKELKAQYGSPNKAAAVYMKSVYPKIAHDLIDSMNDWIDHQLEVAEDGFEKGIDSEFGKIPDGWATSSVLSAEDVQKQVNDHMKLAFKQYKELRAIYGTPRKATLDFMKNVSPKNIQDLIENVDKWIEDRTNELESTVEHELEKTTPQTTESGSKKRK